MQNLNKEFKSELVEAFLAADIPLFKISNPKVRQLFTKLGQPVPSESSCRVHMSKLAEKEVQLLKERLNGKHIFLIVDESEIDGIKYLNILIGETAVPEKTYILNCSVVERVNQQVMSGKKAEALMKLGVEGEFGSSSDWCGEVYDSHETSAKAAISSSFPPDLLSAPASQLFWEGKIQI